MKKILFSIFLVIGIGFTVWLLSTVSRQDRNYSETTMHNSPQLYLPDDVKVRFGKGKINQIAYSPDGAMLAVATKIGIWLYDINNTDTLSLLVPHISSIECIAFSPDGKTLASVGVGTKIYLWNVNTGKHKKHLKDINL